MRLDPALTALVFGVLSATFAAPIDVLSLNLGIRASSPDVSRTPMQQIQGLHPCSFPPKNPKTKTTMREKLKEFREKATVLQRVVKEKLKVKVQEKTTSLKSKMHMPDSAEVSKWKSELREMGEELKQLLSNHHPAIPPTQHDTIVVVDDHASCLSDGTFLSQIGEMGNEVSEIGVEIQEDTAGDFFADFGDLVGGLLEGIGGLLEGLGGDS